MKKTENHFQKGEITEGGLVVERDHLESSNAFLVFWNLFFFFNDVATPWQHRATLYLLALRMFAHGNISCGVSDEASGATSTEQQ